MALAWCLEWLCERGICHAKQRALQSVRLNCDVGVDPGEGPGTFKRYMRGTKSPIFVRPLTEGEHDILRAAARSSEAFLLRPGARVRGSHE